METVNIPPQLYTLIGALVLANIGTIGTLIVFIFKAGMFVATTKQGITEAKSAAVRAHKRIDNFILQKP